MVITLLYGSPLVVFLGMYVLKKKRQHKESEAFLQEAEAARLTEPASLHPVIDPVQCIGCGTCVSACPEHNVLGLVANKAVLVNPTNCIGHGACKTACPQDAIELVFGSATRGVDIPEVSPEFETSVPGIYIAGELGGMGLIKNAIEQGRQAMESISKKLPRKRAGGMLDCIIVGAGPSGLSATLQAISEGLNTITIDQETTGGTVAHFPRGKLVMTAPAQLPLVGAVKFTEISKEELMSFWMKVVRENNVKIQEKEALVDISGDIEKGFTVTSSKKSYQTRRILLTIGRRGTPRKLGVEGEEKSKVAYRMIDPEQYKNDHVLVVGGGDSALEAACSIAELGNSTVTISYRSEAFSRAKPKNRARIERLESEGKMTVLMSSNVTRITDDTVEIKITHGEKEKVIERKNTAIIVCAGGILPTPFLKKIGIEVTTKYGTA